jgi:hypothetical protein
VVSKIEKGEWYIAVNKNKEWELGDACQVVVDIVQDILSTIDWVFKY